MDADVGIFSHNMSEIYHSYVNEKSLRRSCASEWEEAARELTILRNYGLHNSYSPSNIIRLKITFHFFPNLMGKKTIKCFFAYFLHSFIINEDTTDWLKLFNVHVLVFTSGQKSPRATQPAVQLAAEYPRVKQTPLGADCPQPSSVEIKRLLLLLCHSWQGIGSALPYITS